MAISWWLRTCTSAMRTAKQSKKDCCSGPESTQRPFLHGAPLGSGATLWLIFVTPAVPKHTIPPRTSQKEDPVRIHARLSVCAEQHADLQARQWRARSGPLSQGRQSELSFFLPADSCTGAARMISGFCGGVYICRTPQHRPRRAVSAQAEIPFVMFSLQLQHGRKPLAQHGLWRVYIAARHGKSIQHIHHTSNV